MPPVRGPENRTGFVPSSTYDEFGGPLGPRPSTVPKTDMVVP